MASQRCRSQRDANRAVAIRKAQDDRYQDAAPPAPRSNQR
jgi:hypothetical protein